MSSAEYRCPKCNNRYSKEEIECSSCGIIFEKYIKKRDKDFANLLKSFRNVSFEDIRLELGKIVKQYPSLKSQSIKFLVTVQPAMESLALKEYKKSIRLFESVNIKYPNFQEAKRKINKISETIEFQEVLSKGVDALNKERYTDAKYILKRLDKKHPDNKEVQLYLAKLSNYIEIEDAESPPDLPSCPKCKSTSIFTVKKGYDASSACCATILFGPLGLLCGATEANQVYNVCQNCGHKWLLTK
ncbi:hypothetical protein GKODMF_01660 [Candidatus Electrothrix gigas]